jgi:hypothetical protein
VPSGRSPTWPAVNSQRAFGGISTLWLYIATGGATAVGLLVLSKISSCARWMAVLGQQRSVTSKKHLSRPTMAA